jgi:hypothetical protein
MFMLRRLEDRIRQLCAQAVTATNLAEVEVILEQLRTAIHEHIGRLRKLATKRPAHPERRQL